MEKKTRNEIAVENLPKEQRQLLDQVIALTRTIHKLRAEMEKQNTHKLSLASSIVDYLLKSNLTGILKDTEVIAFLKLHTHAPSAKELLAAVRLDEKVKNQLEKAYTRLVKTKTKGYDLIVRV